MAVERKHSGGAQVVRNGPSSPLCSDPPVSVLLFFSKVSPPVLFFWLQFFCSFTLLGLPSQTVLSRSFSLFLLTPKTSMLSRSLFPLFSILPSFSVFRSFSSVLPELPPFEYVVCFSSSPKFFLPPIYKQEEKVPPLLCPIVVQGERAALPLQGKVAGRVCRAWCPSLLLSRWQGMVVWVLAGYGCVGMGFGRVLCKWKREKVSGKNIFKNLLLPCHCMRREEEAAQCRSKRHRAVFCFFFLKKRKKI